MNHIKAYCPHCRCQTLQVTDEETGADRMCQRCGKLIVEQPFPNKWHSVVLVILYILFVIGLVLFAISEKGGAA